MSTPAAKPQNSPPKPKSAAPRRLAPAPRPAHRTEPAKPGKPNAHQRHDMKGMDHSATEADPPSTSQQEPSGPASSMDHGAMEGMDHAMPAKDAQGGHSGHDMSGIGRASGRERGGK